MCPGRVCPYISILRCLCLQSSTAHFHCGIGNIGTTGTTLQSNPWAWMEGGKRGGSSCPDSEFFQSNSFTHSFHAFHPQNLPPGVPHAVSPTLCPRSYPRSPPCHWSLSHSLCCLPSFSSPIPLTSCEGPGQWRELQPGTPPPSAKWECQSGHEFPPEKKVEKVQVKPFFDHLRTRAQWLESKLLIKLCACDLCFEVGSLPSRPGLWSSWSHFHAGSQWSKW